MKFVFRAFRYGVAIFTIGFLAKADCVLMEGNHRDPSGKTRFDFYNYCDKAFDVNLCVKTYAPGSDDIIYQKFSGKIQGRKLLSLTAGIWEDWIEYRWNYGGDVACPFGEN